MHIEVQSKTPMAFLCHASEDKPLAEKIATKLYEYGIPTFFDKWEIRSGDSIRQKIDEGLGGCTHFIALLTPASVKKSWVNAEMDAAFVLKLEGQCKFIPLRSSLEPVDLPPLLRALHSPSVDNIDEDIRNLISDIYEVSKKPTLGAKPIWALPPSFLSNVGLSAAAALIAGYLLNKSKDGYRGDPQVTPKEIQSELGLSDDEIIDGVEDLEDIGCIEVVRGMTSEKINFFSVLPNDSLFVNYDALLMPWNPVDDAKRIAVEMRDMEQVNIPELAKLLDWPARRLNPAINYLSMYGLAEVIKTLGNAPYAGMVLIGSSKTRRFARE